MHVIVAGCGRVGAMLGDSLDADGHRVVVIDRDARAFERLGEDFGGRTLEGIVFDRNALEDAGIRETSALVAVTSGDNSNVVAARTARERYGVEHVVARIYDPVRAAIFERLGLVTVASARWTHDEVRRALLPDDSSFEAALGAGAGEVVIVALPVPDGVTGLDVAALGQPGRCTVAAITREGRTSVPATGALAHPGDLVHVAVEREALGRVREQFAALTGRDA